MNQEYNSHFLIVMFNVLFIVSNLIFLISISIIAIFIIIDSYSFTQMSDKSLSFYLFIILSILTRFAFLLSTYEDFMRFLHNDQVNLLFLTYVILIFIMFKLTKYF